MQLDVESLRTFLAVLDHGGMTAAAERLGVTQSAVSLRIRRLEDRIGTELLARSGRRFTSSPTGTDLIQYARTIVRVHDDAVARLTSTAMAGTVRLGAGEERFAEHVAAIIGRFRHAHPKSTVIFHIERSWTLVRMLKQGDLDIVLTLLPESAVRPDDHVLWTDELIWVVGRGAYIDSGHVPLITFGEGSLTGHIAEDTLSQAGRPFTGVFSGASVESVHSAINAGVGVAVINRRSAPMDALEWTDARSLPDLPAVSYVLRTRPEKKTDLTNELASEIINDLTDDRAG